MSNRELDDCLRLFYAEARTKDGKLYSRSSLLCLRNGIERHLNNPPINKGLAISRSQDFQKSNKLLQSQIKLNKRENKENTLHKPAIPAGDLAKLKTSNVLKGDHPWGLLRNVWFCISLFWCRRGREGQQALTAASFKFSLDENGQEYASMTHDETTKNHQGGLSDQQTNEKDARMYSTSDDPNLDGLKCLKKYIGKLNPGCKAFFQYPKRSMTSNDVKTNEDEEVWYENRPLGVNRLGGMMKEISKLAGLSKLYTNHCVRATAITVWSNAQVPTRHIMAISGHRNEASLKSYNSRPSSEQLQNCSNILTSALSGNNPSSIARNQRHFASTIICVSGVTQNQKIMLKFM
ncbi:hypothetical protein QZH41_001259 [Actinostola sp. cb2023]|nr:hypothetical protein QZH41_001259 [Actinostola sp. cb2023]